MAGNRANLQVGLQFSADTKQAKAQLADLSRSLENLVKTNMTNLPLTDQIKEATNAAAYLKASLDGATNASTGKLDISKFSESLKQGGYSVEQLKTHLQSLGPEGIKAFQKVAVAVSTAEAPTKRLSGLMANLLRSFGQTAKYQFTASIYRGLIGGIQSAYHYAQDLNESLNNIRIVTGQSTEQMARFAEQANKAAQALSTTTTDYTNAALIYYQQGLNDEEVRARTDITMKLANASGVSAETASQQLTAIWNNFAKGAENLEYFADVMTALGASTASSTSEIAEGLEKFAAIGNTVGLSYEYAASALATVTATTRQSADVVGTAFKTLFARIQDLELGDTLEDGTTLGKYSQALAAVGVNIKESNGELKAMDQILNEMAGAWSTISKDQQVALAQTVAGTRQYTQLVALMENWSFMQQNLQTSYNSTGTVQKQQEIYAESWEAARDRVTAAAESIYKALINDEFFIDLLNFFEKFLREIKVAIDALGGLKGVLFTIGNMVMSFAGDSVAKSINNSIYNVRDTLGLVGKEIQAQKDTFTSMVGELSTAVYGERIGGLIGQFTTLQSNLLAKYPEMTQEQRDYYDLLLKVLSAQSEEVVKKEEELKAIEQINKEEEKRSKYKTDTIFNSSQTKSSYNVSYNARKEAKASGDIGLVQSRLEKGENFNLGENGSAGQLIKAFNKLAGTLTKKEMELLAELEKANEELDRAKAKDIAGQLVGEYNKVNNQLSGLSKLQRRVDVGASGRTTSEKTIADFEAEFDKYLNSFNGAAPTDLVKSFEVFKNDIKEAAGNTEGIKKAFIELQCVVKNTKLYDSTEAQKHYEELREQITKTSEAIGRLQSAEDFKNTFKIVDENSLPAVRAYAKELQDIVDSMTPEEAKKSGLQEQIDNLSKALEGGSQNIDKIREAFQDLDFTAETHKEILGEVNNATADLTTKYGLTEEKAAELTKELNELAERIYRQAKASADATRTNTQYGLSLDNLGKKAEQTKAKMDWGKGIAGFSRSLSGLGQGVNTIKGIMDQLKEGTFNFTSFLTTIPSLIFSATSAVNGFKTALSFLGGPTTAIISIAVGALYGLFVILQKIKENSPENQAKKAAEKAEELAKAYDDAKTSAEKFNETISNYSEAVEGLDKLTKGTEEYKKEVEKANKAAEELIKNNEKELSGKWSFNSSTGLIEFDKGALEDLKGVLSLNTATAGNNALLQKIEANNKANQAELNKIAKNSDVKDAINDLAEIYNHNGQDFNNAFERLSEGQQALIEQVDQQQLYDYLKEANNNRLDNIEYQKKINSDLVKFNDDYLQHAGDYSEVKKEFIKDYMASQGPTAQQREGAKSKGQLLKNDVYNELKATGFFDQNGNLQTDLSKLDEEQRKDLSKKLAVAGKKLEELIPLINREELGLSRQEMNKLETISRSLQSESLNITSKQAGLNQFLDLDKTYNILDSILNEVKIIEEDQKNEKDASEIWDDIAASFNSERATANFLQNLKEGNAEGLVYMKRDMTYSGIQNFNAKEFATNFGEQLGWVPEITADEGTEEFDEQLQERERALENFTNKLEEVVEQANQLYNKISEKSFYNLFNPSDLNLSTTDYETFVNTFNDFTKKYGLSLASSFKDILLKEKDPLGLLQSISKIDWTQTSLSEAYKQLKEAGYNISQSEFLELANSLQESDLNAKRFTSSLEDMLSVFKEIQDILSKVSFGQVISSEDYEKLIKERKDLEGKFVYTVNGWMYIGDSESLNDSEFNSMQNIDETFASAREEINNVKSKDITKYSNEQLANEFNGDNFSKLAGAQVGVDVSSLRLAINTLRDDTASKDAKKYAQNMVNAYADAIRNLPTLEGQFSEKSQASVYIKQTIKSLDDLEDKWEQVHQRYQDIDKETATRIVATNELVSRGLDATEWEEYYKTLRKTNPELYKTEELAMRVATANMIASNGLKTLNSNYQNWFKTLKAAQQANALNGPEAIKAAEEYRQAIADIMSISVDNLDALQIEFLISQEDIITKAMTEDETAIYELIANTMLALGEIKEENYKAYIELQQWIADHPLATELEIKAYLNASGLSDLGKNALQAAGVEHFGSQLRSRDLNIPQYFPEEKKEKQSKKNLKSLDDEIDRYHYIRKLLADIERELERVDKAKERAYGSQHLKYIEQETDYLREQVGLQDRYINEIEGYLAKDRGLIAAYGAQFDAAGNISNYNELFASNFNKYANAEDSTNWENFKKALSTYEETLDLWFEQTEEKAELLRQILDKQLEGIQYKVEVNIEVNDRELELLEYQLNRLDDAAYDTADALVNIGSQFEVVEEKIKTTTNGIIDTLKTIPGITQAQIDAYLAGDGEALAGLHIEDGQIEMLQDYSSQLLELSDTIKELHDNALQKVSEAFDAWGEKIEDHIAKFEHLNTLINNYQEIIGLLGRSNIGISNEFMREMRNQEIVNLQGILNTRTQVKDNLAAQLADARKRASEAATEAEREDWEQVVDDIERRLKDATESWQQAWIDALQANKEAFEATMQDIVDSFDDYEDELKRYDTAQDRYLEPYRQAYELSKLTRDIDNSINDQDSIRAKKELQKLEDKIAQIKESSRAISENELGLLQKEYELRLAEIALEDAQNAKSLVRLTRNNEGNWGYTYVADQDKIDEAQQNYEDKLYEYMRAADTMAEEASRTILTLNKEMAEALAALDANAVDYEAKVAEITQFYTDQINYFAEQYGISTDAINTVAKESAAKYKPEVVDIIESDNSGLQTNFDETVLAIIGDFEDLEDAINGPDGALPNIQRAYSETLTAFENYQIQNAETCRLAGSNVEDMATVMKTAFDNIKRETKETDGATKEMAENMKSYLDNVLNNFGDFAERYSSKVGVVSSANVALANSIIGLEKALNSIDASSLDTLKKAADKVDAIAQKVREVATDAEGSGNGSGKGGTTPPGGEKKEEGPFRTHLYGGSSGFVSVLNQLTFDTGGYTGEWGTDGRLAVLHQKELVLNQEDTANILDAVSLIRQMTLGTAQLSNGLGAIGAGLSNFNINPASMDQNVNISASFPNVRDRYEIEEAFNNLVNKASQYAFRENRYTPNYI